MTDARRDNNGLAYLQINTAKTWPDPEKTYPMETIWLFRSEMDQ